MLLCPGLPDIGMLENEEADTHARESASEPYVIQLHLSRIVINCYLNQKARNFFEIKWQQESLTNKLIEITY